MTRTELEKYVRRRRAEVERALKKALPPEKTKPVTLHKAMRYSLMVGGKRLRPILCLAAAEACGGKSAVALPLACAVELIHTYSLIHDDLPCMDDDDFRRGQPTCHKVFGDAVAVLTGDALLTHAFDLVASAQPSKRYPTADLVRELARAAGSRNLIAGQVADLEGEGKQLSGADLKFIHLRKTSALLTSSIRLGAMSANATPKQLDNLTQFGLSLGLAFQVIDDILDVTQTTEKLGKSAGKDVAAEKSTYPAVLGLERARKEAARLTAQARRALSPFGTNANVLLALADYLLDRDY